MEQFNKGTDHALVSQRFSLIKRLGPEPHRRRLRSASSAGVVSASRMIFIIVVHKAARYVLDVDKFYSGSQ